MASTQNGNGAAGDSAPCQDLEAVKQEISSLKGFELKEILGNDSKAKVVFIHALYTHPATSIRYQAVVILEKKVFDDKQLVSLLSATSGLGTVMKNDIYGVYDMKPEPSLNELKATVILPATDRHVEKYRFQDQFMIEESAVDYATITLPYIMEKHQLNLEWIYNILDHKAEQERIWKEDPNPESGFLIAPDLKWDGKTVDCLYVQALVRKRGIKSIRDLTPEHIPMLEKMRDELQNVCLEKYAVKKSALRIYFHYQPSFYHLHVHCVHIKNDAAGQNIGKAVLLSDVLNNLKLAPDYYQKQTLSFYAKRTDPLYAMFVEAGLID